MDGFIIMFGKWEPDRLKKARPREMRVHARGRGPRVLSILLQHRRKRRLQLVQETYSINCVRRLQDATNFRLRRYLAFRLFSSSSIAIEATGLGAGGWGLEKKDKSEGPTAGDSSMNK